MQTIQCPLCKYKILLLQNPKKMDAAINNHADTCKAATNSKDREKIIADLEIEVLRAALVDPAFLAKMARADPL